MRRSNATWGRRETTMAKRKRHSRAEIASKLAQANDLATQGKLQSAIARTLGVSVMTLHRWRKASQGPQPAHAVVQFNGPPRGQAIEWLNSSSKIHGCGAW